MSHPDAPFQEQVPVTAIVFTLDEEVNLPYCLDHLRWCDDVVVIDSFSSDRTTGIARERGARVFQREFDGFGSQRNWALQNAEPRYDWVLILDADERVPDALASELREALERVRDTVGAFRVRRRFYMWGKWLRYSSLYPTWVVRLVHRRRVRFVNRGHAETQEVSGTIESLSNDLIDENHKGIESWVERQNRYSTQDAAWELEEQGGNPLLRSLAAADPLKRRSALKRVSRRLPARPLLYFLYAYLWRRGFLDGREGFQFCLMRAMYQRLVVLKKLDLEWQRKPRRSGPEWKT